MSESQPQSYQNVYQENAVTWATPNPIMTNPDAVDEEFIEAASRVLIERLDPIDILLRFQRRIPITESRGSAVVLRLLSSLSPETTWHCQGNPRLSGVTLLILLFKIRLPSSVEAFQLASRPKFIYFNLIQV